MSKSMGLGRGLGSLIPNKQVSPDVVAEPHREFLLGDDNKKIHDIPVDLIEPNPGQPRQTFNPDELEELIESIKKFGIIQPIIVTKNGDKYQLIAGERRLRSAKIIGLETVPAIVREAGEQEKFEMALIENIQRSNLNAIEKAVAYERLMAEFNLTQEEVGERLGVSRPGVANSLRFLTLPEEAQRALVDGRITEGHAKVIAGLDDPREQLDFLNKILQYNYNVRDAERESKKISHKKPKARFAKDPIIEDQEDQLRKALNTKVNINQKAGKGQIVIDFYSLEEMNNIINEIIKRE